MCVHMYVCMYITHMYVCMYIVGELASLEHIMTELAVSVYVCMYVCEHIYIYTHIYEHPYAEICEKVMAHLEMSMCICVFA